MDPEGPAEGLPLRVSGRAKSDMARLLQWSRAEFWAAAEARYRSLLRQALRDVALDPARVGVQQRDDLMAGVLVYHMRHSAGRVRSSGTVKDPRHLLDFRQLNGQIEVIRVLHDARDLARHVPARWRGPEDL